MLAAVGCAGRSIPTVQAHHGREFRCDRRYVHVEALGEDRWSSRGCGFTATWTCLRGECELEDSTYGGSAAP